MKRNGEARGWWLVWLFSITVLLSIGCGVKGPPVAPEDLLHNSPAMSVDDEDDPVEEESGVY